MMEMICEVATKTSEVAGEVAEKAEEVSVRAAELGEEVSEATINELGSERTIVVAPDIAVIKETTLKSLITNNIEGATQTITDAKIKAAIEEMRKKTSPENLWLKVGECEEGISAEKIGLTETEEAKIIDETGWSTEIVDCIESIEQYEIYKNAELHEAVIGGRKCLIKNIDMDYVDPKTGMTNRELMEKGRSPIDAKTGEKIELHHMGQDFNSPFAELCENSEHGDGKDGMLHDKKVESWRNDKNKLNQYNNIQRPNHWIARAKEA